LNANDGGILVPRRLTLITGGARSGKSALAQKIGEAWRGQVCFVATATAGDQDMAERIARHRSERPTSWTTMESPVEVTSDISGITEDSLVIIDCVTMWVSNLLLQGFELEKIEEEAAILAEFLGQREAPTVVVTNEVGLSIVPDNELARRYQDTLGRVNQALAHRAERALFVSAGRITQLEKIEDIL